MKNIYYLVICVILLASCSPSPSANTVQTAVAGTLAAQSAQQGQATSFTNQVDNTSGLPIPTQPTATRMPTATRLPTATILPTNTPLPTYSGPLVIAEFSGTGEIVTDDFKLPPCFKAVLYWTLEKENYNFFILDQHNKDTGKEKNNLNIMLNSNDVTGDVVSGYGLTPLLGGTYYWSSGSTSKSWTVRIECHDADSSVGKGMNIQAAGSIVTDNYTLSACNKSVFTWSADPDSTGHASVNFSLCSMTECNSFASNSGSDLTSPLTGQALQAVNNGDYFLVSDSPPNQTWSVTWECKD